MSVSPLTERQHDELDALTFAAEQALRRLKWYGRAADGNTPKRRAAITRQKRRIATLTRMLRERIAPPSKKRRSHP